MTKKVRKPQKNEPLQRSITRNGKRYNVGISKDKDGYYAHTHRARSKSYPSKKDIPVSVLKFIESTG
ncbi:hypothetical protein [Paenibacillus naphthalenovorans]|uniref:hypothetical protein n=1 Tax=Paenibacillus naphthalenovorans TaxID=162209 RepID=UPI003D2D0176